MSGQSEWQKLGGRPSHETRPYSRHAELDKWFETTDALLKSLGVERPVAANAEPPKTVEPETDILDDVSRLNESVRSIIASEDMVFIGSRAVPTGDRPDSQVA